MKIRKTAIAAAIAAVFLGIVGTALPAQAASSDCPSGAGCAWQDSGFEGREVGFNYNVADYGKIGIPGFTLQDEISSVYNAGTTGRWARWYQDHNYTGNYKQFVPFAGRSNLADIGFNDRITSGCFQNYCS